MTTRPDESGDSHSRLDQVLADYLHSVEAGTPIDADELMRQNPDLADELQSFFANRAAMERLAAPLQQGSELDPTIGMINFEAKGELPRVRYFGDYELIEELGRGGMGVVYRARQTTLNRMVALKMILAGNLASSEDVRRFRQEAEAAANLDHPHIAPIYETGEHNNQHYFSMKLIEGPSLLDALPELRKDTRKAVRMLEQVARGVHHAHQRGVLHRDLKPANILLDREGTPYVTDFGLAKRVEGGSNVTTSGAIVGTPSYMAPEQARGEKQLSTAIDVYSLGAILYEILAGRPPFKGNSPMDTLVQVMSREPERPSSLVSGTNRDLETICLKCLEKEPAKRYGSAETLADDLGRFLRCEPIRARPIGPAARSWRWAQRNPLSAALATGLMVVVIAGIAGVVWQWREAVALRQLAMAHAAESQQRLVRQYVTQGSGSLENERPLESLVWFAEALKLEGPDPARQEAHRRRIGAIGRQVPRLVHFFPHEQSAQSAFTPDGRRIVTYSGRLFRIWDAESGDPLTDPLEQPQFIWTVAHSQDSRYAAVISNPLHLPDQSPYSGSINLYDISDGRQIGPTFDVPNMEAWQVRFTPDSKRLLVGSKRRIQIINVASRQDEVTPIEHELPVRSLALAPDNTRLLVNFGINENEGENQVQLFDLATGRTIGEPIRSHEFGNDGPFSSDGKYYVTNAIDVTGGRGDGPAIIQVRESATADLYKSIEVPHGVRRVMLSGDPPAIVTHLNDEQLYVHGLSEGDELRNWKQPFSNFTVAADGQQVAAQQRDTKSIVIFQLEALGNIRSKFPIRGAANVLTFSPDGQRLAVAARGPEARQGEVHLIDLNSRERVALSISQQYGSKGVEFSPDGRRLLFGDEDGNVRNWDVTTIGSSLRKCSELEDRGITVLELSSSEKWLAIGQGHDDLDVDRNNADPFGLIRVWNISDGEPVGPEVRFGSRVQAVRFGPDERTAVVTLSDGSAALIDVVKGLVLAELPSNSTGRIELALIDKAGHLVIHRVPKSEFSPGNRQPGTVIERRLPDPNRPVITSIPLAEHQWICLSPLGDQYMLVDPNRQAVLFDTSTGNERARLGRLHGTVRQAAFSPDGKLVVLVFEDQIAEIWDIETRSIATQLIRNVEAVRFSHRGRELLTSKDGVFRVWDATTGEPLSGSIPVGKAVRAPLMNAMPVLGMNSNSLISTAGDRLRVWNLEPDGRPVEQLLDWVKLMSGHHIDDVGGYATESATDLAASWRMFAARDPISTRIPSAAEVDAWHVREAWQSELQLSSIDVESDEVRVPATAVRHHVGALLATRPDPDLFHRRGTAALLLGDGHAAVADLTRAMEGGLDANTLLRLRRGRALDLTGDRETAAADVARAFELGQREFLDSPARWEKLAAIAGLNRRLELNHDDGDALELRASLNWEVSDFEGCLRDCDRLIAAKQIPWFLLSMRAGCLTALQRWDEAIAAYSEAIGPELDAPDLLEERGFVYATLGQFDAATADLDKARTLVSYTTVLLRHSAVVSLIARDQAKYKKYSDETARLVRKHFGEDLRNVDGSVASEVARTCLLAPGGTDDLTAMVHLARIGNRSPRNRAFAAQTLALALCRQEQPDEALKVLAQLERHVPPDVHTATIKAMALHQSKNSAEASKYLVIAESKLAALPYYPLADRLLAEVLLNEVRATVGTAP